MPRGASTRTQAVPARQNLLTRPNDLTHAAWAKVNVTISGDADAGPSASVLKDPFGSCWLDDTALPLDGIIPAAGVGVNAVVANVGYDTPATANRRQYTYSVVFKAGPLGIYGFLLSPDGGGEGAYFNMTTGAVGTTTSSNIVASSASSLGSGYFRATLTIRSLGAVVPFGTCNANLYLASANGVPSVSTGDGATVALYAGGFQMTTANRAGPLTINGTPLTPGIRSTP